MSRRELREQIFKMLFRVEFHATEDVSQQLEMFFDDIEDKSVLVISDGKSLYKLLDDMFGFEFYITNFETNYLLCFNHHDCVLGCGTAKNWVESLNN